MIRSQLALWRPVRKWEVYDHTRVISRKLRPFTELEHGSSTLGATDVPPSHPQEVHRKEKKLFYIELYVNTAWSTKDWKQWRICKRYWFNFRTPPPPKIFFMRQYPQWESISRGDFAAGGINQLTNWNSTLSQFWYVSTDPLIKIFVDSKINIKL